MCCASRWTPRRSRRGGGEGGATVAATDVGTLRHLLDGDYHLAAGVVPRHSAATLVGLTSGILAAFLGVGDFGALNTLLSYTAVGLGTDLALLLLGDPAQPVMAMLAAVFGHVAKFLVKWGMGVLTGAPVGFVALGLARALLNYVIFGAIGGLLGSLTLAALRKAGFFAYIAEKQ